MGKAITVSDEETFIICEFNCATGVQVEREATPEEAEAIRASREESLRSQERHEAEQAEREQARQSGNQKLRDLGLTESEISALTGVPIEA